MRVGLIGRVRRVWAPRGVKIVQQVEYCYEWAYLTLAVDGLAGKLAWAWTSNMKAESIAASVKAWAAQGIHFLVWDRARGHRGDAYDSIPVTRIEQPPASPELNPPERIFEYLRSKIEGIVYGSRAKKRAAVETELEKLATNPELVKSLAGWDWIRRSLDCLYDPNMVFS
jgi:transposase